MKIRLIVTLALLLCIVVISNEPIATTTRAQSQLRFLTDLKDAGTSAKGSSKSLGATCFCRIFANGVEVAKPSKGGYVQPFQAEACRNYCRGIWDSSQAQRIAWAKLLPGACGNVTVTMEAALGTMSYQQVRGPETETGINGTKLVTTCSCPSGQQLSNTFGGTKYCINSLGTTVPVPDQVLQGGYLVQSQVLYRINGPASCVTKCQ